MFKYDSKIDLSENTSTGKILKKIKKGSRILEFGCAAGRMTRYMHETLGCCVSIIELDKVAYAKASAFAQDGICGDIMDMEWVEKYKDIRFDYIIFADVLEHLTDPDKVIKEASELLSPDGMIIISIPNITHGDIILKQFNECFDYTDVGLLDDTHIHFWGLENIRPFAERNGLFVYRTEGTLCGIGETEQKLPDEDISPLLKNILNERKCSSIYQFVITMGKDSSRSESSSELSETSVLCKIYPDSGSGFSESTVEYVKAERISWGRYHLDVCGDFSGIKRLRIDPVEKQSCIVHNVKISQNNKQINPVYGENIPLDRGLLLTGTDPTITADLTEEKKEVKISVEFTTISDIEFCPSIIENYKRDYSLVSESTALKEKVDDLSGRNKALNDENNSLKAESERKLIELSEQKDSEYKALKSESERQLADMEEEKNAQYQLLRRNNNKTISRAEKKISSLNEENLNNQKRAAEFSAELQRYRAGYDDVVRQNEALRNELAQWQNAYNAVTDSDCWKMTKPVRSFADGTKRLLKKNKVTYYFCKGLLSLKREGVRATWKKVNNKLSKKKVPMIEVAADNISQAAEQTAPVSPCIMPSATADRSVKFSIIVPLYNTDDRYLREMIQSVIDQTYDNWELCLADGSDEKHNYVRKTVSEFCMNDPRIKYKSLVENLGISENTNQCVNMATGDYIAFLDHDDVIAPNALMENARAIAETKADVLYSDEDHLSADGAHINPFYKPDWSPDLLHSQMYICHLTVIRKSLFDEIGGFDPQMDGSQDYDLMLRLSEKTDRICHIPMVLYSWRECEGSTAANADAKPYAHLAGRRALDAHLKRRYGKLAHAEDSAYTFVFDARFDYLKNEPLVSVIIPMKDKWEMTDNCIHSILDKSTYSNFEILILDNRSEEEATFEWFDRISAEDDRIRVIPADMEFNWSKLNNYGIAKAKGDVYIFLNNDTLVITPDWIERLAENALRDDAGAVGALLLYEDNTIQHAGILVGFGGWADHIFKGMSPVHYGSPFVSPMVSRNVLAVTGACMAISRKTINKIGLFDDEFIICGSDVEICVRAYENGLFNIYKPDVQLYHLESKSRDSYIPEVDFKKSYECYTPYRENVDPFFNINLDINSLTPAEKIAAPSALNFKNYFRTHNADNNSGVQSCELVPFNIYGVGEIQPIIPREDSVIGKRKRLNLLIPSVDKRHVYGGIATALKFFEAVLEAMDCDARVIVVDAPVITAYSVLTEKFVTCSCEDDHDERYQLVPFSDRAFNTIPVGRNDIFIATAWWTAYTVRDVVHWQSETFGTALNTLIYLIQDYEPGFYAWSSRYMLAESTYRMDVPTLAVVNSGLLKEYLEIFSYSFEKIWSFEPVLNHSLRKYLPKNGTTVKKKKQIILYGRPSTERNAFSVLVLALRKWCELYPDAINWRICSAGEKFGDIDLGNGCRIESVGKLSLEDYAKMMTETYAGISLMVSPHPSYPPLEMASFGIKTITNRYFNKDLSSFSDNIISLSCCEPSAIAKKLAELCSDFSGEAVCISDPAYTDSNDMFGRVELEIAEYFKHKFGE